MRAKATSLRMALFWLEKAGHLVQLGSVADLIAMDLTPARLAEIAEEQSSCGVVAKAILSIAAKPEADFRRAANAAGEGAKDGLIGGFVNWLSDLIGLRFDRTASPPQGRRLGADETAAVINISQIRSQCRLKSTDETMAVLADLQRRGCLKMRWALDFAKRPLLSEPERQIDGLISSAGNAVRRVLKRLELNGRLEFNPLDYLDREEWGIPDLDEDAARSEKMIAEREALLRRYHRAYLQGFRTLARASGIRMKQLVRQNEEAVFWVASIPPSVQGKASARCNDLLSMAPALLAVFKAANEKELTDVAVQSLIGKIEAAHPRKTFRIADLEALLRLFSALNLVSTQPELIPLSYVLHLTGVQKGFSRHQKLVEELNDVNTFAEARSFAMEVFANLPQPVRGDFIGPYFAQANGTALKAFLETQLGEIEGEDNEVAAFIAAKRDQLRATRATEFFERYRHSQEPAQWQAISHPFNRHLLVNAGPGAGKTSVLVARITHLIREQRIKPSEIIVLAFNRAVVFEIRKRIRELFKALGYAAYASQVRVFTFHALARRSMANSGDDSAAFDNLLSRFAARLQADAAFRKSVAGECRSILVDEFQDVTDDVYSIIRNLHLGSGEQAGVMVIGDDDQDILRWQRKAGTRENGAFAEAYFQRFRDDFGGSELRALELCVNFRSGADIVAMSQKMITAFFERNPQSNRLKTTLLRQADTAGTGCCERIDARGWDWGRTASAVVKACMRLRAQNPGTLAVLCRTNDEVAEIHRHLAPHFPDISVQSSENMHVADFRHVALWCDFLEAEIAKDDRALTAGLLEELSRSFRDRQETPETDHASAGQVELEVLWELCREESVFPHLS
ncbi:MAG: UvrD-helicase domain-containing protein, partial [Novosphingobium sp.]